MDHLDEVPAFDSDHLEEVQALNPSYIGQGCSCDPNGEIQDLGVDHLRNYSTDPDDEVHALVSDPSG